MPFFSGRWRQRSYSLTARFIALAVGLFAVLQTVQLLSFTESVRKNAQIQQNEEFDVSRNILMSLLEQRQQMLLQSAQILAADFGLREAVSDKNLATIESALENHAKRLGAPIAVLLDTKGDVVASTVAKGPMLAHMAPAFAPPDGTPPNLFTYNDTLFQLVKIPVKAPMTVGYIVMGFAVDDTVLNQFTVISGTAALIVHEHGSKYSVQNSTLMSIPPKSELVMNPRENRNFNLHQAPGQTFRPVLLSTLTSQDDTPVYVLLASSIEESLARYAAIKQQVIVFTVLGGILFALLSIQMTRNITQPLRKLMGSAGLITQGDLVTPIETKSKVTEIQTLSTTLEHMREGVRRAQDKIHQIAYTDALTSLPNRLQLVKDARQAINTLAKKKLQSNRVFLFMFDLQRFKHVNDVLGYDSADKMLQSVGAQAQAFCAEHGLKMARVSADEFAVLFPNHTMEEFEQLASKMQNTLEKPIQLLDTFVDVNTVGGFSVYPDDASSAENLIQHAEIAMYESKRRRHHLTMYLPDMDASSQKTLSLLSELREAIAHDQLRLFVQPKIDLSTLKVDSLELLVRWQHPTKGLVPPMDFIPFAEQTGFIRQLTQWVFVTATKQQATLRAYGLDLSLSLNLSVHDLMDPLLLSRFANALVEQNVPADTFCLEITESAIMDDPSKALVLLEELRAAGFKLSIDDFGTGYSSLAYLKLLPVQELKIDKSFVMHMDTDPLDAKIVRSTIDLAHNLDLYVTAEGIENPMTLDALAQLGCDKAQGYEICRPMAFEEFLVWLGESPYRPDVYLPALPADSSPDDSAAPPESGTMPA